MIPRSHHGLVRLSTVGIVRSAIGILGILVEAQDDVRLVSMTFISHLEHIVRERRHGPVVRTDDTLIVVRQCLTTDLCEQSVLAQLGPRLVEVQGALSFLAPDALMLDVDSRFEVGTFVIHYQTRSLHHEVGFVHVIIVALGSVKATEAHLPVPEHLQTDIQLILFHITAVRDFRLGK